MESGVVFFGKILKEYTSVTVSTPSGLDEVCELTEATLELSDESLEDVFELSDDVFELSKEVFELPKEVFDSSEAVFDLPHEVNKKIKQRNKNKETSFFIVTTPFAKMNYIIYLLKEQHH